MKLATLQSTNRDGTLIVVNRQLTKAIPVPSIAKTLQAALDDWATISPRLTKIYQALNDKQGDSVALNLEQLAAPLPRAFQWLDGSAYLSHVERVRKARGAELPPSFQHDPLMYQGASDVFLGAQQAIVVANEDWGIDFEAEVGIITDDVEMGVASADAAVHIKLLVLINDVSLRNLIPNELAKGFGFIHGKPASVFSPVVVTPDELGENWQDSKLHLPLRVFWNERTFGQANAGRDMQFNFAQLISHAAKTRSLSAGTIIGSGTISNYDTEAGYSCIVEKRVVEIAETGKAVTEFMHYGDRIRIEMKDHHGQNIFGAIDQRVEPWVL